MKKDLFVLFTNLDKEYLIYLISDFISLSFRCIQSIEHSVYYKCEIVI